MGSSVSIETCDLSTAVCHVGNSTPAGAGNMLLYARLCFHRSHLALALHLSKNHYAITKNIEHEEICLPRCIF